MIVLLERGRISLHSTFSRDEADRMLDMCFDPQLEELLSKWTCHFQVSGGQCCLVRRSQKRSSLSVLRWRGPDRVAHCVAGQSCRRWRRFERGARKMRRCRSSGAWQCNWLQSFSGVAM